MSDGESIEHFLATDDRAYLRGLHGSQSFRWSIYDGMVINGGTVVDQMREVARRVRSDGFYLELIRLRGVKLKRGGREILRG